MGILWFAGCVLRRPVFVVCGLLLLASAVGLRPALKTTAAAFEKEAILPRRPLKQFDVAALPSFVRAATPFMALAGIGEVGTDEYVVLHLVERGGVPPDNLAVLAVTYYADPHCMIPHTPDVCYRQAGAVVKGLRTVHVDVPGLGPAGGRVAARAMRLEQREGNLFLMFVLCASGEFCADRLEARCLLSWPGDRYAYFAKIEVSAPCPSPDDEPQAQERCFRLLREALPHLMREHLPDAQAVKGS